MINALTAKQLSLMNCHSCGALCKKTHNAHYHCPRCGSAMHFRIPNSISRTWAFLLSASILYIPANTLPIMKVTSLGQVQSDTIISGVIYLLVSGSWMIAAIVFVASVFVPVLKLIILFYLLISVHRKSSSRPLERTKLFRMTEAIGRWSMVDIYAVTIMVALVEIQGLADVDAGPGAVAFGAVVVLTMLAAQSFDPRLIWDNMKQTDAR